VSLRRMSGTTLLAKVRYEQTSCPMVWARQRILPLAVIGARLGKTIVRSSGRGGPGEFIRLASMARGTEFTGEGPLSGGRVRGEGRSLVCVWVSHSGIVEYDVTIIEPIC